MSRFLDALTAFGDRITDVDPRWAAAAMAVQLVKTFVVARAWRSVLTGAYPGTEVRFLRIWGAYLIGVGTNALIPLRGGDAAKVIVAKRQIDGASYVTVGSTLLVLALFDFLVGSCLFVWANAIGALPSLHLLHRRAFDIDWIYRHRALSGVLATALGIGAIFALGYAWRHMVAFKDHMFQGFRELRSIRHYLLHVVPWQALDWTLRIATVLLFLRAFGLPGTLHNAGLAQVTQDLSTAIPISPGGIGTSQALLLYLFQNVASQTGILAFSVGMQALLLAVNAVLGIGAMVVLVGSIRFGRRLETGTAG